MALDLKSGTASWAEGVSSAERVEVVVVGDLCPRGRTEPLVLGGRSNEVLADVMPVISQKDLSIINLETVLTTAETAIPKSGPNLKVDPRCVDIITEGGFDVACCANNHIGDYGPDEVVTTLDVCHEKGVDTVGAGGDLADARMPLIVERKGMRIAMLAFAENEFGIAGDQTAGANPLDPLRNIQDIRAAASAADVTIVLVHGGNEYNPIPSPRMVQTYRAFAEAGATAVVAGHPHGPQGIELWGGVPIVYSPGNFLFDARNEHTTHFWWTGYIVRLSFAQGAACELQIHPYTFAPAAEKVVLMQGEDRESFLAYLDHISGVLTDGQELRRYWEAWCAKQGPQWTKYLTGFAWPVEHVDDEAFRRLLSARNAFSCEAHNELLCTFLRMAVEGRVEEASAYIPRLEQLQKGEIPA